jgi:hypothetical protein
MSHALLTIVFLGGVAASAWLSWHGRPANGVALLLVTVIAVCVISAVGVGKEDRP